MALREQFNRLTRYWRPVALWTAFCLSAASAAYFVATYVKARGANAAVTALNNKADLEIDAARAPDRVVLARINELLRRDRFDEAQGVANAAAPRMSGPARAHALYNLANERVQHAITLIAKGDLDGATALVNVAKGEYRLALRSAPDIWDIKYNLDVAMRMVRDLPAGDADPEEAPPDAPTRVWTDLPGVPKGLP